MNIFAFRFLFAETNVRDFRVGVSAPRHDRPIDFLPEKLKWHQDVSNDDARSVVGSVGELETVGNIACGVDVRLRSLEILIHFHTICGALHAGCFEI